MLYILVSLGRLRLAVEGSDILQWKTKPHFNSTASDLGYIVFAENSRLGSISGVLAPEFCSCLSLPEAHVLVLKGQRTRMLLVVLISPGQQSLALLRLCFSVPLTAQIFFLF